MSLSDTHTIEHDFSDLQPVIGGIRLDLYINGTAELENDPVQMFAVRSITIPGDVLDLSARPRLFGSRARKNVDCVLTRPEASDHSPEAVMFRLLETAIYEDQDAIDAWHSEMEMAA